jgi:hypothetical protein
LIKRDLAGLADPAAVDAEDVHDLLSTARRPRALSVRRPCDAIEEPFARGLPRVVRDVAGALAGREIEEVDRVDSRGAAARREQALAVGRERRAERALKAGRQLRDADLAAGGVDAPAGRRHRRRRGGGSGGGNQRQ